MALSEKVREENTQFLVVAGIPDYMKDWLHTNAEEQGLRLASVSGLERKAWAIDSMPLTQEEKSRLIISELYGTDFEQQAENPDSRSDYWLHLHDVWLGLRNLQPVTGLGLHMTLQSITDQIPLADTKQIVRARFMRDDQWAEQRDVVIQKLNDGNQVVLMPMLVNTDAGSHWVLIGASFDENQQLGCDVYNPKADGKCGDRVIWAAHRVAREQFRYESGCYQNPDANQSGETLREETARVFANSSAERPEERFQQLKADSSLKEDFEKAQQAQERLTEGANEQVKENIKDFLSHDAGFFARHYAEEYKSSTAVEKSDYLLAYKMQLAEIKAALSDTEETPSSPTLGGSTI